MWPRSAGGGGCGGTDGVHSAKAREDARTHNVVSVITAGNEASIRLHERFGFTFCGTVPEVGVKFGRLLDIDHYSLLV